MEDEVSLAVRAIGNLQRETGCDLGDCAAIVFASPSYVPLDVARKHLGEQGARQEHLPRSARRLACRLGIPTCPAMGINWFCSGYSKALSLVLRRMVPRLNLGREQFILVITSSRISRITDYSCKDSAALFGDLATATLLARSDSQRYPLHFRLLHAHADRQPVAKPFFDFHLREDVLAPAVDGGRRHDPRRLVFSLDGMGIAEIAPRAMAGAVADALAATGIRPDDVHFVLPHQAGTGIVRFTAMKVEQLGVRGEVLNGLTMRVGNVSSGSIPYSLKEAWLRLAGTIACPTAAVGPPGACEVSQGCLLLRATPRHEHLGMAAA
jgi:3-oxoacyl-[acyl-carrier-protein] synthase III